MAKNKIVIASGVFDLIHLGHIRFLEKAKEAGGVYAQLIVVVARDSTVNKMKGKLPLIPEQERRAIVEMLKPVDMAVLGNEPLDIAGIIKKWKPDIIAVGYDQNYVESEVRKYVQKENLPIEIVKIEKLDKEEYSSSKIKHRVISQTKRD